MRRGRQGDHRREVDGTSEVIRCGSGEILGSLRGRGRDKRGPTRNNHRTGSETGFGDRRRQLHPQPVAARTVGRRSGRLEERHFVGACYPGSAHARQRSAVRTFNLIHRPRPHQAGLRPQSNRIERVASAHSCTFVKAHGYSAEIWRDRRLIASPPRIVILNRINPGI